MHTVKIYEYGLTDGSAAHDVVLPLDRIPAISREDAEALAEGIADLIRKHTNEDASVRLIERVA